MFLAVDAGNTNIVLGLYEGEILRKTWRMKSDVHRTTDETRLFLRQLLQEKDVNVDCITAAMVASVIPRLSGTLQDALEELTGIRPMLLTHELELGIQNLYNHPENVGPDRLANAVGGIARYGAPLAVVDFGTATTFDVITRNKEYLGGVILPGLEMSADSLFQKTSMLPRIAIARPDRVIGRSTLEAITSGIVLGSAAMVDALMLRIREELSEPDCTLIATGGHAPTLAAYSHEIKLVDNDLTLFGMLKAWEQNT
jgi:type III pantothenate kinase